MYKELTSLLELKINSYDKDLKEVNNDIKEIKELYDIFNRYDALESAAILNSYISSPFLWVEKVFTFIKEGIASGKSISG